MTNERRRPSLDSGGLLRGATSIAAAVLAVPVALATMVAASGAVDPEADSAAATLAILAVVGLFATTGLMGVGARVVRAGRIRKSVRGRPGAYRAVVVAALGLAAAQVAVSAFEGLQLEALFLPATLGLLVALGALLIAGTKVALVATAALGMTIAALGLRDGPYEPSFGFWAPRILLLAAALAALAGGSWASLTTGRADDDRP